MITAIGNAIAIPFSSSGQGLTIWTYINDGLDYYKKGRVGSNYLVYYSSDGGFNYEEILSLVYSEDLLIINLDQPGGVTGYRQQVRDGALMIDHVLTETGFDGDEGTDWENIEVIASWQHYWRIQDEVLFFGEISRVADGKLYNQKAGATDYLTVAGVAGSYTFQAPNTAPYIAADTDYIWFKADESQRTPTTAELIAYDLQRTPVKYLDSSPNTLSVIMILSSAVTGDKRDYMFRDFHLPLLWDNDLNLNGYVKSNRDATQELWPGDATLPYLHKPTGDEYAFVADSQALNVNITTGFTFAMWIRGTDAIGGVLQYFGGKLIFGATQGRYGFMCQADNKITFYAYWPGTVLLTSTVLITDQAWHHCAVRYSPPNGRFYFYLDNVLTGNYPSSTQYSPSAAFDFYLGAGNNADGSAASSIAKIDIAEAVIYSEAISLDDLTALYNHTIKAGYLAYWKLAAYPLVDETGNFNLTSANLSSSNIEQAISIP